MSNKPYRNRPDDVSSQDAHGADHGPEGNGANRKLTDEAVRELTDEARRVIALLNGRCIGTDVVTTSPLDDYAASAVLANGVRFLHQLVFMTSSVLATVDTAELRNLVGPELKLPVGMVETLKEAGVDPADVVPNPTGERKPENPANTAPQKRPRGRKHPLLSLLTLAVQATRLIDRITAKTNPHAHNLPTYEEREQARRETETTRMLSTPL